MSSVDAAGSSETVNSNPSPAEQPPSQPDASGPQEPSRDDDTPSTSPEIEPRVASAQAGQDVDTPQVAEGSSSSGEVLMGVTGTEHVEGVDPEQVNGVVDDSQQWTEDDSHELKRVKVYELMGSRWVDQGTAYCFGDFQDNEALLIARAEEDYNRIILTTTIRATDVYQRQQGA